MIKIVFYLSLLFLLIGIKSFAQVTEVSSPDGKLKLNVFSENGKALYNVTYQGKVMLEKSPLGLITNESDFSKNLSMQTNSASVLNFR